MAGGVQTNSRGSQRLFTQAPQSQSVSFVQASLVHVPLDVSQRKFVEQLPPALQGNTRQPLPPWLESASQVVPAGQS